MKKTIQLKRNQLHQVIFPLRNWSFLTQTRDPRFFISLVNVPPRSAFSNFSSSVVRSGPFFQKFRWSQLFGPWTPDLNIYFVAQNNILFSESTSDGKKRPRTAFTPEQVKRLESEFQSNKYLSVGKRLELSRSLKLTETQVNIIFWNFWDMSGNFGDFPPTLLTTQKFKKMVFYFKILKLRGHICIIFHRFQFSSNSANQFLKTSIHVEFWEIQELSIIILYQVYCNLNEWKRI